MKKMKKTAAMLMAATVAMAMPMTAMAASITVENAKQNEVYKAYKIFDYNKSGDSYAYTMAADSEWRDAVEAFVVNETSFFTLTPSVNDKNTLVVTTPKNQDGSFVEMSAENAKDFAAHLAKYLAGKNALPNDEGVSPDSNNQVNFGDLTPGYYFVDTSTGAVCSLFNSDDDEKIREKNDFPEAVKNIISKDSDGNDVPVDSITSSIDGKIQYKITVTDKSGTDKAITVHDEMGDGLTWDGIVEVTDKGGTVDPKYYTLNKSNLSDDCKFEVELHDDYVSKLGSNDTVDIVYGATLNKDAVIAAKENGEIAGNKNSAYISYSNQEKIPAGEVTVYTYKFGLVKTDKNKNVISTAKFELYENYDEAKKEFLNKINLVEENGAYRVAQTNEKPVDYIEVGNKEIKGLGNGTYYLKEVEAPQGYNALAEAVEVKIKNRNEDATVIDNVYKNGGVQVINYTGTILPSTGGIGTTVFYAAGIVVMAGAVFFVVRSRKHD